MKVTYILKRLGIGFLLIFSIIAFFISILAVMLLVCFYPITGSILILLALIWGAGSIVNYV